MQPFQKRIVFFLTLIALMIFSAMASAAEFSAETTMNRFGKRQKVKVYVKGNRIREEMVDIFGQRQVLIANPGKRQTLMLYPATQMYMEIPSAAALSPIGESEEDLKKIGTRRLIGQENASGYLCDKYEIAFHNTYRGKMLVWIARKLNYPIRMSQVGGPSVEAMNRELTKIKEGPIDDSLFELPGDYRKVKKPAQGFCGAGVCSVSFY